MQGERGEGDGEAQVADDVHAQGVDSRARADGGVTRALAGTQCAGRIGVEVGDDGGGGGGLLRKSLRRQTRAQRALPSAEPLVHVFMPRVRMRQSTEAIGASVD